MNREDWVWTVVIALGVATVLTLSGWSIYLIEHELRPWMEGIVECLRRSRQITSPGV